MSTKLRIIMFIAFVASLKLNSQTILSQDFEGPLTGWFNNGTLTGGENGVTPYAGSGMVSLGSGKYLESPYFVLPAGNKYISFWVNGYFPGIFTYTMTLSLLQNGSPVMNLGSWYNVAGWAQKGINIPVGFSGNDFAIKYTVASNGGADLKFYIDDILIENGFTTVSLQEQNSAMNFIDVRKGNSERNELLVKSGMELENVKIQVISVDGKLISETGNVDLGQEAYLLPLHEINSGLYFIKFISKEETFVKKMML